MSSKDNSTRKKPIKGYYVASRYKQAAEVAGQSSKSREKSPELTMRNLTLGQSTLNATNAGSSRYKNAKKYSSTPANPGRHGLPAIDASSITDVTGFLCVPKEVSEKIISATSNQTYLKNKTKNPASKGSGQPRTGLDLSAGNTSELNILYAEYLQAKLLECNMLESCQKRSKNAAEKIHKIWCLMQQLLIKDAKIYQELSIVSHLVRLHEHLQKQEEMLEPVLKIIPHLESQYEAISNAVDIVRHKLEVKNVPVVTDTESEEVIQLLLKISGLIQSLQGMQDSEEVITSADITESFLQQGRLVADEIKRTENLLSEANDLLIDETLLKLTQL